MSPDLNALRNLIASGEDVAARLHREDIDPVAARILRSVFRAVLKELGADNCGVAGCDCKQAQISAVELPQAGARPREQEQGGAVSILSLLHPMDSMGAAT